MISSINLMELQGRITGNSHYFKNEGSGNGGVFTQLKFEELICNNSNNNNNWNNNHSYERNVSGCVCPFPGCQSRVKYAKPGHETCCCPLHHILVMCKRFCMMYPSYDPDLKRFYAIGDTHTTSHCVFDSCSQTPGYKGKWCTELHYLDWLSRFSCNFKPNQRCKLRGCVLHVFVEVESDGTSLRVHDFCSWTHCQLHHLSHGLTSLGPIQDNESAHCMELTPSAAIESLKLYAQNKSYQPKGVLVDEHFFNKHPKDVLNKPGHQSCWIIVKCKWNGHVRALKTRDGYHWKQHGRRSKDFFENSTVVRRHLSYNELQETKRNSEGSMPSLKFNMVEYTLIEPEIKDYCLVKLQKGKLQRGHGHRESMPRRRSRKRLGRSDSNLTAGTNSSSVCADANELAEPSWIDDFYCH